MSLCSGSDQITSQSDPRPIKSDVQNANDATLLLSLCFKTSSQRSPGGASQFALFISTDLPQRFPSRPYLWGLYPISRGFRPRRFSYRDASPALYGTPRQNSGRTFPLQHRSSSIYFRHSNSGLLCNWSSSLPHQLNSSDHL